MVPVIETPDLIQLVDTRPCEIRRWPATETETFDAVMVCVGIHSMGNMPSFEGQEDYKGKLIHSINYRQARFQNELRISHSYSCLVLCDGRLSNQ